MNSDISKFMICVTENNLRMKFLSCRQVAKYLEIEDCGKNSVPF